MKFKSELLVGRLVVYWQPQGLVFIMDTQRMEESHPCVTRTHCLIFLELQEYSCEYFWIIGHYLWITKMFGLAHKPMVVAQSHFEQSATRLGKDVWTLLATISDDFCGFICIWIIPQKYGDQPITIKVSTIYSVRIWVRVRNIKSHVIWEHVPNIVTLVELF